MFSQSIGMLDIVEEVLRLIHWTPGKEFLRIDGKTQGKARQAMVEAFNNPDNRADGPLLMLISTRAGSLGINLVGASRVIILDALWNPSHELQAVFRAYRYGQERPVP